MNPPENHPRKIVVAVDGSEPSLRAVQAAISLAETARAPLHAVTVVQTPLPVLPPGNFAPSASISPDLHRDMRTEAGRVLERVAAMARRRGVPAETRVLEGHVPTEIARYAERGGFDLVVVGSRGLSGISRWLLGSVSTALVQRAGKSVLVVR